MLSCRAAAVAAGLLALGGCANMPLVGMPENAPPRPATEGAYPAVHDVPAPRETTPPTPAEQTKREDELNQTRQRQNAGAAPAKAKTSKRSKND